MNKTTSFSKISANRKTIGIGPDVQLQNSNQKTNNFSQKKMSSLVSSGNNSVKSSQSIVNDSFLIDSINESDSLTKNGTIIENNPEIYKNEDYISSRNQVNKDRIKNWKSESNLELVNRVKLEEFNKSLNDKNYYEDDEYDDYDIDYYIDGMKEGENDFGDDLTNEPLEFSDHAALYDQYINGENMNADELTNSKYLNEHKRLLLLDNYDMYTKKNYKLTYNDQNDRSNHFTNNSNDKRVSNNKNRQQILNKSNNDSLASSALMERINNFDESYYNEKEAEIYEYDNENSSPQYMYHQQMKTNHSNAALFKNAYLHSLKNQNYEQPNSDILSSMNSSNQQISDSIMNWSMKISNYNNQQQRYDDDNRKRSKSRSPPINHKISNVSRSNSSFSKFFNQENILEDSFNLSPPIQFQNDEYNDNKNSLSVNAKSTTSWGKLKHSKSSSSHIGGSIDDQDAITESNQTRSKKTQMKPYRRNHTTNDVLSEYSFNEERPQPINNPQIRFLNEYDMKAIEELQNYQMLKNNIAASSPSLFKLFQNSKQMTTNLPHILNSDEMSSETNSSSFSHNNPKQKLRQKKYESNQKKNQRLHEQSQQQQRKIQDDSIDRFNRRSHSRHLDEQNRSNIRTTSFSKLRQRSLSSCALSSISNQCYFEKPQCSTTNSINQSDSTNSTSNNLIVKKSVGIQHPIQPMIIQDPGLEASTIVCMLVDRNNTKTSEELMAVAARAARAYKRERTSGLNNNCSKKASLPDLTFLKDYTEDKPRIKASNKTIEHIKPSTSAAIISHTPIQEKDKDFPLKEKLQGISTQTALTSTAASSELKRKTLKSIKRYRQIKQNTEPCSALFSQQIGEHDQEKYYTNSNNDNEIINNLNCTNVNSSSTSSSSGSGVTNTSGYASQGAAYIAAQNENNNNLHETQSNSIQRRLSFAHYQAKEKQPLKSCLKRKDSQNSTQSHSSKASSSTAAINSPMIPQNRRSYSSTDKNQQLSMIVPPKPKSLVLFNSKSIIMFVPCVGYLFTCDKDSPTRYDYYNKIERTRKIRTYRGLTSSVPLEEYDEEEDEEDETLDKNIEIQQGALSSRSDNDLRVKKSVTFLAHVIEYKQSIRNMSGSSNAVDTPIVSPFHEELSKYSSKKIDETSKKEAPLLQYNALIAMLKSNSLQQHKQFEGTQINYSKSQKSNSTIQTHHQPIQINTVNQNIEMSRFNDESKIYFKNQSQTIEADSISLGSLSESPPSEFKFSDEEGNDSESENIAAIKAANNFKSNDKILKESQLPQKISNDLNKPSESNLNSNNQHVSSKFNSTNQIIELSKNIQQQQIKLNHLELLRNKKKNFHSILLKDSKLNNLKEILFEIKQQQQKLNMLAKQRKDIQEQPIQINTTSINSFELKSLDIATMNVSVELRDTIEQLSQYIFEFLKQGIRPVSIDSIQSPNMSGSNLISPITSPGEWPISDSNSLTLSFSQYTQIWNIIEHTISTNLSSSYKTQPSLFNLPKEAYINMFQEINNYANNTNQTYLIDSGINTSQLRRKHHLMVMLKGLKFKYQLFIVNLLNYKQIANWFDYLNKDKNLLKKYYDLKFATNNNSGDSGVGELLNNSGSSSISSSLSLSQYQNATLMDSTNILTSLSVTSLTNVSIFENDEYFNYYTKVLQQFNFVEFNLKSFNANHEKHVLNVATSIPNSPSDFKPKKPAVPARKPNSNRRGSNTPNLNQTLPNSQSTPISALGNASSTNGVLKSISKRFNIKSWFSNTNGNNSPSMKQKEVILSTTSISQGSFNSNKNGQRVNHIQTTPPQSNKLSLYDTTPTSKCCQNFKQIPKYNQSNEQKKLGNTKSSNSVMKHSLSEPTLNAIIN